MNIKFLGFTLTRGEQLATEVKVDDGLTPTQRLARAQAESVAEDFLASNKFAKRIGLVVLLAVMAVSFEDQYHYLVHLGFRPMAAILVAGVFDLATIFCVNVIGTPAQKTGARMLALGVCLLPTTASGYINVQASPTKTVAIIYIAVVAMIPAIEVIKAFMGANLQYMRKIELSLLGVAAELGDAQRVKYVVTQAEKDARKRAGYTKMSPADKAKFTFEYRRRMASKATKQAVQVP